MRIRGSETHTAGGGAGGGGAGLGFMGVTREDVWTAEEGK